MDASRALIREFCAENFTHVPAAIAAGAARIELCDNLAVGGTTPSFGVAGRAVAFAHDHGARVMTIIRPRGGDFFYTSDELEMMEADARIALALGSDGIVLGCLARTDAGAAVDWDALERFAALAREVGEERGRAVDMTFHMAFDELDDAARLDAIDRLPGLGFTRILTHGGAAPTPIEDNFERLRREVGHAAGQITILPGGGVTCGNAATVAGELGVVEVHGTKIVPFEREA